MRIIAGEQRGRRLDTLPDHATRPPLEMLRQMIFNVLGDDIVDTEVLDLFAGCGSLGLEALSRGAKSCTFVEASAPACAVLRSNVERLGLSERCEILRGKCPAILTRDPLTRRKFGLIFTDPPFDLFQRGFGLQHESDCLPRLAAEGTLVSRVPSDGIVLPTPVAARLVRVKTQGASSVRWLKFADLLTSHADRDNSRI